MKKTSRRYLAMICVLALFSAQLAGCDNSGNDESSITANSSSSASTENSENSEQTAGYTLPIVEPGSLELTYAGADNWYTPASYTQNLEVWQEVEKRTGIKINWEVSPSDQYSTAMQTRMAAGAELPDIFALPPLWSADVVTMAEDGQILPLSNLIETCGPNIQKMFDEFPVVRQSLTAPDGEIYNFAEVFVEGNEVAPKSLILRMDWLDAVGMEVPQTIDDWYNVLKAFKEQDPNGNGVDDEVPLTASYGGDYNYFASGFGLPAGVGEYFADENGKVQYTYTTDEYYQLLVFLNKLYAEGLMDPQYATQDEAKVDAMVSKNIVGCSPHYAGVDTRWKNLVKNTGIQIADYQLVVPPVDQDGNDPQLLKRGPTGMQFGLSKDCKDPEAATKWVDYIWASDEGVILTHFGIEGKSFVYDENGNPVFTEWVTNNPDGLDMFSAVRSLGAFPSLFDTQTKEFMSQSLEESTIQACDKLFPYMVEPYPTVIATAEEADELAFLTADLNTYASEMIQRFVMGTESLDNFDNFVAQLEGMGLQDVLKIKQDQYDRFMQS